MQQADVDATLQADSLTLNLPATQMWQYVHRLHQMVPPRLRVNFMKTLRANVAFMVSGKT